MNRVQLAVLDALSAQDTIPVVVHQKRMAEHRAASYPALAVIAQMIGTTIHAHMGVGSEFQDGSGKIFPAKAMMANRQKKSNRGCDRHPLGSAVFC